MADSVEQKGVGLRKVPLIGSAAALLVLVAVTAVWGVTFVQIKDARRALSALRRSSPLRFAIAVRRRSPFRPRARCASLGRDGVVAAVRCRRAARGGLRAADGRARAHDGLGGRLRDRDVRRAHAASSASRCSGCRVGAGGVARRRARDVSGSRCSAASRPARPSATCSCSRAPRCTRSRSCSWSASRRATTRSRSRPRRWRAAFVGFAVVAVAAGQVEVPHGWTVWGALLVTGVFASAVAFLVQAWAQQRTSATQTALVFSLEPVWAGDLRLRARRRPARRGRLGRAARVILGRHRSWPSPPPRGRSRGSCACGEPPDRRPARPHVGRALRRDDGRRADRLHARAGRGARDRRDGHRRARVAVVAALVDGPHDVLAAWPFLLAGLLAPGAVAALLHVRDPRSSARRGRPSSSAPRRCRGRRRVHRPRRAGLGAARRSARCSIVGGGVALDRRAAAGPPARDGPRPRRGAARCSSRRATTSCAHLAGTSAVPPTVAAATTLAVGAVVAVAYARRLPGAAQLARRSRPPASASASRTSASSRRTTVDVCPSSRRSWQPRRSGASGCRRCCSGGPSSSGGRLVAGAGLIVARRRADRDLPVNAKRAYMSGSARSSSACSCRARSGARSTRTSRRRRTTR